MIRRPVARRKLGILEILEATLLLHPVVAVDVQRTHEISSYRQVTFPDRPPPEADRFGERLRLVGCDRERNAADTTEV